MGGTELWRHYLTAGTAGPINSAGEPYLFWSHLLLANLIGGVTIQSLNNPTPFAFGVTHPSSPLGGGFRVANVAGTRALIGSPLPVGSNNLVGTALLHVTSAELEGPVPFPTGKDQPLTPALAAQIDRKMDDGLPGSGTVQAFGLATSCYDTTQTATPAYRETVLKNDCGLMFLIGN